MLTENLEDTAVLVGQQGIHITSNRLVLTAREAQLTTHLGIHTDVELSDMNMLHQLRVLGDSCIDILLRRTIDIIVPLHTDTMNGYTSILHLLDHVVDAVTLARVALVIVVIEQQRIGVSLMGKLESLGNKLITAKLIVTALTIRVTRCKLTISE